MLTQACAKLYKKAGLHLSLSQRPLRSARQRAFMDRVVTISVNRNHEAVMLKKSDPPPEGGWTVMAYGKQCRPGKSFQNTISNIQHAPSFIGESAAIRLIGLSQRSSCAIFAKLRDMQKTIVFANLYSRVPPYQCCLGQCSSLWCRFAKHTNYRTVQDVSGCHRP